MDNQAEINLVKKAQSDPNAFGEIYQIYHPKIFNYILKRIYDQEITEDITAEVFIKAFKNIQQFHFRKVPFLAWLYRIASNEINNHHKQNSHKTVSLDQLMNQSGFEPALPNDPQKDLLQTEKVHTRKKDFAELQKLIHALPTEQQTLINLKFFGKKSLQEIGQITGKKTGTVKSGLSRSLQKLRKLIDLNQKQKGHLGIFVTTMLIVIMVASLTLSIVQTPAQVFAKEIVRHAITDLASLKYQDQNTQTKIQFLTNILNAALDSNDLQYVGEEKAPDGSIIKKLRFTDEDLSQDVMLKINLSNPLLDAVDFEFADELHLPFDVVSGEVKNGHIVDKITLQRQLLDPSIQKQWIKELIQQRNHDCLQRHVSSIAQNTDWKFNKDQTTLSTELTPFINSAEVLILGCNESWSYDQNGVLNQFHLSTYSFGDQKKKLAQAREILDQALAKLSHFNSPEADQKIALLQAAKTSKELKYSPWPEESGDSRKHLTFIQNIISKTAISLIFDPNDPSINAVQFRFTPDQNSDESRNVIQIIKVSTATFMPPADSFQDHDFQNNAVRELLLNQIIKPQNGEILSAALERGVDQKVRGKLSALFESSELLILEPPYFSRNSEGQIDTFAFRTYSFGAAKKYQIQPELWKIEFPKLLDTLIQKLSVFKTSSALAKIDTLQKLKKADFSAYDGDFMSPDENGTFGPGQKGILLKRYFHFRFTTISETEKAYNTMMYDPDDNSENSIRIEGFVVKTR